MSQFIPETAKRGDWPRLVARAVNYLTRKVEGLLARTDYSGWAIYSHGGGAQALTTDNRTTLSIDGASKLEGQLPPDTGPLWDTATSTITGREGDAIVVKIQCIFTPSSSAASNILFDVDIGGAVGVVEYQSFALTKGAGNAHFISWSFVAYTLDTWEANGGAVNATADGPGSITQLRAVIARIHKAR